MVSLWVETEVAGQRPLSGIMPTNHCTCRRRGSNLDVDLNQKDTKLCCKTYDKKT